MIRLKIILCLCFIHFALLQAQTTSRFPINPLARWKISDITYFPDSPFERINEKYEYFIESDTMINSQHYYKLYKSGIAYYDTPFYYEKVYAGAIRDDDNKFYLIKKEQTSEVLLIDYNLKLGDTIHGEIGNMQIINEIDTLIDGRKVISSVPVICGGCCSTITLLEGIGHSGGIMEDPPCYHIGFYGHFLNCFEIDGELIYQNDMSLVNCEDFFTSIDNLTDISNVNIYPVPATYILSIEILNMPAMHSSVSIFDISGSLVLTREIQSNKTEIDIRHLKKGMYFVRISDQTSCITKKIVVE